MAMLSEVPPPFAHAAVAAACRALRPGEAEFLLRSAPPAFDAHEAPTRSVGIFALLEEVGDRIIDDSIQRAGVVPNLAAVLDAVLARSDGQWLARAWLQHLIWKS